MNATHKVENLLQICFSNLEKEIRVHLERAMFSINTKLSIWRGAQLDFQSKIKQNKTFKLIEYSLANVIVNIQNIFLSECMICIIIPYAEISFYELFMSLNIRILCMKNKLKTLIAIFKSNYYISTPVIQSNLLVLFWYDLK